MKLVWEFSHHSSRSTKTEKRLIVHIFHANIHFIIKHRGKRKHLNIQINSLPKPRIQSRLQPRHLLAHFPQRVLEARDFVVNAVRGCGEEGLGVGEGEADE